VHSQVLQVLRPCSICGPSGRWLVCLSLQLGMSLMFILCLNPMQPAMLPDDGRLETDVIVAERICAAAAPYRPDREAEDGRQPD
jgi:hypothetical protein